MEVIKIAKGNVIGSWRISKEIGAGGQGTVWEVRRVRGKSPPRAMKACFLEDSKERERFLREIRLLRECESGHILPLIESVEVWEEHIEGVPPFAYYVAERCDGTLKDAAAASKDMTELLELFHQACRAVSFLHTRENPVIHRDIKPENFLVGQEPRRVVLADFGIAKEEEQDTKLTETNEIVGSRFFRAPEILSGSRGTLRSDVYSMGRLLEWLLTGVNPEDLVPTRLPRGRLLSDDACEFFDHIIGRACALDPHQRYATVDELRSALPELWFDIKPRKDVQYANSLTDMSTDEIRRAAYELVRNNDTVGWRELERAVRRAYPPMVTRWRAKYEKFHVANNEELFSIADELVEGAMPRILLGLVGATAGRESFSDQRRTVDDLITIDGWSSTGLPFIAGGLCTLVYIFHYLHGACCIETGDLDIAVRLALVRIPKRNRNDESEPLWQRRDIVGWPTLLGRKCVTGWKYLLQLPDKYPVLDEFFGPRLDYRKALAFYNALLTLFDLADNARKFGESTEKGNIRINIPPMFCTMKDGIIRSINNRVFGDENVVTMVASSVGSDIDSMRQLWPEWTMDILKTIQAISHNEIWPYDIELTASLG